jgi:hypothetical protein
MAIKKWTKEKGVKRYPAFHLTKEANPDWFARVYWIGGKYSFEIGKRIGNIEEPTPARYSTRRSWKSPITAKEKAIEAIRFKQFTPEDDIETKE